MQRPLLSSFTQSANGAGLVDREDGPSCADPGVLFQETATAQTRFAVVLTSLVEKVAHAGDLSVKDVGPKKKLSDYGI